MNEATVQLHVDLPATLVRDFLQYIRSFDAAHAGCHFQMAVTSDTAETGEQIAAMLEGLNPPIPPIAVIRRRK